MPGGIRELRVACWPTDLKANAAGHIQAQIGVREARLLTTKPLPHKEWFEILYRVSDKSEATDSGPIMGIGHNRLAGSEPLEVGAEVVSREGIRYPNLRFASSLKAEYLLNGDELQSVDVGTLSPEQADVMASVITLYSTQDFSVAGTPRGAPNCTDFVKALFAAFAQAESPEEPVLEAFLDELDAARRPQEAVAVISRYFSPDEAGDMRFRPQPPA